MRLWSINFSYLDNIGLIALWREGLLAQAVLAGKTVGYKNHPQLERFKNCNVCDPLSAISNYLMHVYLEAKNRGYNFDYSRIIQPAIITGNGVIPVNRGQIQYEFEHLLRKLQVRDVNKYNLIKPALDDRIYACKFFKIFRGEIESWEKVI